MRKIVKQTMKEKKQENENTSKEMTSRLLARMTSLDLKQAVRQAMEFLHEEFSCNNLVFFPESHLARELDHKIYQRTGKGSRFQPPFRGRIQVWQEPLDLELCFSTFPLLLKEPSLINAKQVLRTGTTEQVLMPVRSPISGEVLGHFILLGAKHFSLRPHEVMFDWVLALSRQLHFAKEYTDLKALTYRDDLTDLYNQRYLPVVLEEQASSSQEQAQAFSVLFVDVDYFKSVNDNNGHLVGSKVLVELSRLFKASIRATDFAFRYGGDEYVIVLPGADAERARMVAERLRVKTQETPFEVNGVNVNITVSIGIASFPEHTASCEELLHIADEAMYFGKNRSRNVVYLAS